MNRKIAHAWSVLFRPLRPWIFWVIGLAFLVSAVLMGIGRQLANSAYRRIFERDTPLTVRSNPAAKFKMSELEHARPAVSWLKERALHLEWTLNARDHLKLSATYIPPSSPSNRLVILLHGYRGQPEDLSEMARVYHEDWNYHVLMPSARAHGASDGDVITFGYMERLDLADWVETAIERLGEDCEIVLHGFSMGAATVLLTGGERLPLQVKALVADSAYSSLEEELRYGIGQTTALSPKCVLRLLEPTVFRNLGFHLAAVSPKKSLMKCTLPVLLLHNYDDPVVPVWMTYELAEVNNLAPAQVEFKIFSRTGHCRAFFTDHLAYLESLNDFLGRALLASEVAI